MAFRLWLILKHARKCNLVLRLKPTKRLLGILASALFIKIMIAMGNNNNAINCYKFTWFFTGRLRW